MGKHRALMAQRKLSRFIRAAKAGEFSVAFVASPFAISSRWIGPVGTIDGAAEVEIEVGGQSIIGYGANPTEALRDCAAELEQRITPADALQAAIGE